MAFFGHLCSGQKTDLNHIETHFGSVLGLGQILSPIIDVQENVTVSAISLPDFGNLDDSEIVNTPQDEETVSI